MGLFDKLKNAVNTAADSIAKAIEGNQPQETPLQDETVKKYYEIIFWMRKNHGWDGNESTDETSRARRYIELMLGEPCNEEKFKTAVELINMGRILTPKTQLEKQLNELNDELKSQLKAFVEKSRATSYEEAKSLIKYDCESEKAYRVCYKELIAEIKSEYDMILDVIKDNVKCEHFGEGFKKRIFDKYIKQYDSEFIGRCVYIVISDSFIEGNPVIRELLFAFLVDILANRVNERIVSEWESPTQIIHAFALRALHFEEYDGEKDEYVGITYDECREHVLSSSAYEKILNDHPFEKDDYIKKFAKNLKEAYIFDVSFSSYSKGEPGRRDWYYAPFLFWATNSSDYFLDTLYNYAWKEIAKEYTNITYQGDVIAGESKDPTVIATMFLDYFKKQA